MLTSALGRDDAALVTPAFAATEYGLTAGAGTDNARQTGATLDLRDGFGTVRFTSLTAVVSASATLAADKTLTVTGQFEHSSDNTTWSAIGTAPALLTLTGAAGGSTGTGAAVLGCNLAEAQRFVRFAYTPDLSATGTDTAKVSVVYALTGADRR